MNHVKVVNVIIYKLQTKQGTRIILKIGGLYHTYCSKCKFAYNRGGRLTIEVESESGSTEAGRKNIMKLRIQAIVM